jgi:hypothetical protein
MTGAIAAAIAGTTAIAAPAAVDEAPAKAETETVNVDKGYLSHMTAKLQARSNDDGKTYVLYARVNVAGATKLAYCEASKWSTLSDKRIVGAVSTIAPE